MESNRGWPLPNEAEETDPEFIHYGREDLPTFEEPGVFLRLLAGEAFGAHAAVRTHSPLFYLHWQLGQGARVQLPGGYTERAAYVAAGRGDGRRTPIPRLVRCWSSLPASMRW